MIEEKCEENKEECQRIAQEFIYDEKRKSECVKYLIDHFKISQATAYRWYDCLLYTSPSPRDLSTSRMPSSA